jgi:hypothetical protein
MAGTTYAQKWDQNAHENLLYSLVNVITLQSGDYDRILSNMRDLGMPITMSALKYDYILIDCRSRHSDPPTSAATSFSASGSLSAWPLIPCAACPLSFPAFLLSHLRITSAPNPSFSGITTQFSRNYTLLR